MHRTLLPASAVFALLVAFSTSTQAASARVYYHADSPPEAFAAHDIEAALKAAHFSVTLRDDIDSFPYRDEALIFFGNVDAGGPRAVLETRDGKIEIPALRTEGFALRRVKRGKQNVITIHSRDAAGAMYGGLELAEQIRTRGLDGVTNLERSPYLAMRGTKFNIPLDLRTPSYTDMGDSAQENIATVWDFEFWRAYLDQLARDRYNYVSLWNLHPFPSMVKVPGYEDVALDDVWRSKIKFDEDYSTRTTDLVSPAMLADREIVKQLTMDQKIEFWRRVMRYAKDRNIDFYVVTWNIYTYGVDGKHGITDALDNPKTVDYFRASVREMFRTYPLLAGIGVTAGENMGDASAVGSPGTELEFAL